MPSCPECGMKMVRQASHRSAWERFLRVLCIYPFRCQLCDHRFLAPFAGPRVDARRDYERLLVGYPASFSSTVQTPRGQIQDAKGTIVNLSIRGCQMRSELPLQPGAMLRLTFTPTDQAGIRPIVIEQAVVRSSSGKTNGIEFIRLGAEDDKRIRQIVHDRLHSWMNSAGSGSGRDSRSSEK